MSDCGQEFVRRLSLVFIGPPKIKEAERPTGPERSLSDWRLDLVRIRQDVIGKPGLYLDRSATGSGKTTADIEAVRKVGRALIVTPTHENGEEVVDAMKGAGINAMKYPARSTGEKNHNCDNDMADTAEGLGLSVVAAVCPSCQIRAQCLVSGYLAQLAAVKLADVAIATHARAVFNGLGKLSEGRTEFLSIHEDATNTICPDAAVSERDLQLAADIVGRVLNDPKWLNRLGPAASRIENGEIVANERLTERRDKLNEFVRDLADLIDSLLANLRSAERTQAVTLPAPKPKANGIDYLLLRASLQTKAKFSSSLWRLLLAALTGELFSAGVIVDEDFRQKPNDSEADKTKRRILVGVWKNLPSENAVVLFSDATANRDDWEALLGRPVVDVTPVGRIAHEKRVVQFTIDLTRCAKPKRFLEIVRGALTEFPDARRVGVITHRTLLPELQNLSGAFEGRLGEKHAYFGSGSDRASNDWHGCCDLILVVGTPRVSSEAVQRRLIQFGDFASAGEDGRWGDVRWRGRTEAGDEVIVVGRGYEHPAWERAHRSLVRAAIVQAVGRARTLLENGCDVVVISTEECGFPIADKVDIELTDCEDEVLVELTGLSAEKSYVSNKTFPPMRSVTTAELAQRLNRSERRVREILVRLESRRLVCRDGARGGWMLASAVGEGREP
jgi:hypothetical protein